MIQLIAKILDEYHDIMDNKSDQRTTNWFMMSSPLPTIVVVLSYIIFVTKIGPAFMKNRKPFELKMLLIIYNAFQVVISAWIFYEGSVNGWLTFYSYRCQPVDYSDSPVANWTAQMCWYYYILKFIELFDTIFFVLRKKNKQITTLHVIHHSIMPVSVWFAVKFFAGGQSTFAGFLNSFVHTIMYSYYLLAALGPWIQPYLWWKRYITQLQLIQFILIVVHSLQTLVIDCDIPKGFVVYIIANGIMFIVLFGNFYYQSYLNKRVKTKHVPVHIPTTSKKNYIEQINTITGGCLRHRNVS